MQNSFPIIARRNTGRKAGSTSLAKSFIKRLDAGVMVDNTSGRPRQSPKKIPLPKALEKFRKQPTKED